VCYLREITCSPQWHTLPFASTDRVSKMGFGEGEERGEDGNVWRFVSFAAATQTKQQAVSFVTRGEQSSDHPAADRVEAGQDLNL